MPEPYLFPELPSEILHVKEPKNCTSFAIKRKGFPTVTVTPPLEETNFVSFICRGSEVIAKIAFVLDDDGKPIWIREDGTVIDTQTGGHVAMVMKVALTDDEFKEWQRKKVN